MPARLHTRCPECRSHNVLVVLATSWVAALRCRACEHQFVLDAGSATALDAEAASLDRE